MQEKDR